MDTNTNRYLLAEFDFNTTVGEFGCKAHTKFPFLRASPDGINIDEKSKLFGRLV